MRKFVLCFLIAITFIIGCKKDGPNESSNEKFYLELSGDKPNEFMWTTKWQKGYDFTWDDWNYLVKGDDVIMNIKFLFDVQVGDTVVMNLYFGNDDIIVLDFYKGDHNKRQYQITKDYIYPTGYCFYRIEESDMVEIDIF